MFNQQSKFNRVPFNRTSVSNFALDFDVTIDSDGDVYGYPTPAEIFSLSARSVENKIDVYFDAVPTTFRGLYEVESINLLEELKAESNLILGTSSSNEINMSLVNENRKLSPTNKDSIYSGKLVPNVKIVPYICASTVGREGGDIGYQCQVGVFYSGDWQDNTDNLTISTVGYDVLYQLYNMYFDGIRPIETVTYYKLFELLLNAMKKASTKFPFEYTIDTKLNDYTITVGWLPSGNFREALNLLTEASNSFVYTDRQGKVIVECLNLDAEPVALVTDENQIYKLKIPTSYMSAYSRLDVNIYEPSINDEDEEVIRFTNQQVSSGTTFVDNSKFSKSPVMSISKILINDDTVYMVYRSERGYAYKASADNISFCLGRGDLPAKAVDIIVYGFPINTPNGCLTFESAEIKDKIGEKIYTISNVLIQNRTYAQVMTDDIFRIMLNPQSNISADIRGTIAIRPGSVIIIDDPTDKVPAYKVYVHRVNTSSDGGMSSSIEGYITEEVVLSGI